MSFKNCDYEQSKLVKILSMKNLQQRSQKTKKTNTNGSGIKTTAERH